MPSIFSGRVQTRWWIRWKKWPSN